MEYAVQSPESIDMQFDRNDLIGISLGGDDPVFKRGLALDNIYRGIIDESGVVGTMSIEDTIDSEIENDDELEADFTVADVMPDETDLSMDGIDADEEIEAEKDVMSGEADDDSELLDAIESTPLQEEVKNVSSRDIQAAIRGKINSVSKNSVTAKDIQKSTASSSEEVEESYYPTTAAELDLLFGDL